MPGEERVEWLAALCRVWRAARFFHPWFAEDPDRVDGALLGALPEARAASTVDEFHASVSSFLSALGDPGCRLAAAPAADDDGERDDGPLCDVNGVSVLVASRFDRDGDIDVEALAGEVAGRQQVVLDLREAQWMASLNVPVLLSQLLRRPVQTAGTRTRLYSGWPSEGPYGSGNYVRGWRVEEGKWIQPRGKGITRRPRIDLVTVIDSESWLLPVAIGLQRAGLSPVVVTGEVLHLLERHQVDLPGDRKADVRVAEWLVGGHAGFEPDARADVRGGGTGGDVALEAAASLLGSKPKRRRTRGAKPHGRSARGRTLKAESPDVRLLGLFTAWSVMDQAFAYHDLMDEPWSDALTAAIPEFESADGAPGYGLALARLMVRTQDGHCGAVSEALAAGFGGSLPGLTVQTVEGRPVVIDIYSDGAKASGVVVGDVVVSVDGRTVAQRHDDMTPRLSASNEAGLRWKRDLRLLAGHDGTEARVGLEKATGKIEEVRLPRTESMNARPDIDRGAVFSVIGGSGYIDLVRLTHDAIDEAMATVRDTPALILDMRGYPKGTFFNFTPRLARGKAVAARFSRPEVSWPPGDEYRHVYEFEQTVEPGGDWQYEGKVVVLVDERAVSQSEHTCLWIEAAVPEVTFIGSTTQGTNGDVTHCLLPAGASIGFTGHNVRHGDGRQLQRVGIVPDIEVTPTIAGIRAGRDEVLEAALAHVAGTAPGAD